jgi:hypothetical protein
MVWGMKKIPLENSGFFTTYAIVDDEDYERVNAFKWCYFKWPHGFYSVEIGGENYGVYNQLKIKKHAVRLPTEEELFAGAGRLVFLSQFIDRTPSGHICYATRKPLNYQKENLKRRYIHTNRNEARREALNDLGYKWKGIDRTEKMRVNLLTMYYLEGAMVNQLQRKFEDHFIKEEIPVETRDDFLKLWETRCRGVDAEESGKRKELEFWVSLNGVEFENELGRVFQGIGYKVKRTPATGDGGVDLILEDREGKKIIVQCKAHKKPVGVGAIRDLLGTLYDSDAEQAILASISGFTQGVYDFAIDKPIKLLGSEEILKMARDRNI